MKKQRPSIDGFVPRRSGEQLGDLHRQTPAQAQRTIAKRELHTGDRLTHALDTQKSSLSRSEINASLRDIDQPLETKKLSRKQRRMNRRPITRRRRIIKWVTILIVLALLGVGGFLAYKAFSTGSSIFKGNIFDAFTQNVPLKQDSNGRSNILILGTSDDDPGHDGANLTDSIMVLSVDQNNKNAYMISIPRDLYVKYGRACSAGYEGKINAYYDCATQGTGIEAQRAALTKTSEFMGGILGMDIQYGVNVNYTVMRDLVNAVGGITVTIESRDPRGVMDSNFDWKCGVGDRKVSRAEVLRRCPPNGHFIDFPNGPVNLDAEHALYLAQARGDIAPTYGLEQSNPDREKNQQKIIKALREKAMSAGVLTNAGELNSMLDALGTNLRTTFDAKEVKTLISLAQGIKTDDIKSISLDDSEKQPVFVDGNIGGASVVRPSLGLYDYSGVQARIQQELTNNPVTKEKASVEVLNGSSTPGVAQKQADILNKAGFIISDVGNAPTGKYANVEVYQLGTGNQATAAKLKEIYGVAIKTSAPPFTVGADAKFVVVFGADPAAAAN